MKKVKKVLRMLLIAIILLGTKVAYAATSQETVLKQVGNLKYICIGAGIVLILLVLWISYKSDRTQEGKENQLEDDDDEDYDDDEEDMDKEQSLYESFNMSQDDDEVFAKNTIDNENKAGFQLDEIFEENVSSSDDISTEESSEFASFDTVVPEEKEVAKDVSLEDDFLRQMNQNLPSEEDQETEDLEVEKPAKKTTKRTTKSTTKKLTKEEPKKTTRKTKKVEEPEEKTTKKTTTKKTTTKKTEEEPKKTTRRTKKTEEPEEKTTKKTTTKKTTTKKTEEEPKKTTRKTKKAEETEEKTTKKTTSKKATTKKKTEEEPKTTTKRTTRKKKEE